MPVLLIRASSQSWGGLLAPFSSALVVRAVTQVQVILELRPYTSLTCLPELSGSL